MFLYLEQKTFPYLANFSAVLFETLSMRSEDYFLRWGVFLKKFLNSFWKSRIFWKIIFFSMIQSRCFQTAIYKSWIAFQSKKKLFFVKKSQNKQMSGKFLNNWPKISSFVHVVRIALNTTRGINCGKKVFQENFSFVFLISDFEGKVSFFFYRKI